MIIFPRKSKAQLYSICQAQREINRLYAQEVNPTRREYLGKLSGELGVFVINLSQQTYTLSFGSETE
jgi:hypothetical protein